MSSTPLSPMAPGAVFPFFLGLPKMVMLLMAIFHFEAAARANVV
jgi:hypothetical protein